MDRPQVPTAREMMARSLVTLNPEMPAIEAAETLIARGISGAPVVDSEGRLVGLLSELDCLRVVSTSGYEMDAHDAAETVADLMTRDCLTVSPDLDLFGLAHEFVQRRVRRFPVVEEGRFLGQVSRRDALRAAVALRREMSRAKKHYPDYPEGRDPIHDYPR